MTLFDENYWAEQKSNFFYFQVSFKHATEVEFIDFEITTVKRLFHCCVVQ